MITKTSFMLEYKIIDCSTEKGLRQAEKLQSNGWKVIEGSLFGTVTMEREKQVSRKQRN